MAGILTPAQQQAAWHDWITALQQQGGQAQAPCPFSVADLVAAVQAIDAWCTSAQAAFMAALPEPFKTTSTAAQKAALLAYVVMRRFSG